VAKYGDTALHFASRGGHVEMMRFLLSAEGGAAEAEAKNNDGHTPFHVAAQFGQIEAMRYLLGAEVGVDREATDANNATALHLAIVNKREEAVQYLLSAEVGANAAAVAKYGDTALHFASRGGHVQAIEALASLGASPDPDDDQGAKLLRIAGSRCEGVDEVERTAATVVALRAIGCKPGPEAKLLVDNEEVDCQHCFGPMQQCEGQVLATDPLLANTDLSNVVALRGKVAVCRRGKVLLTEKAKRAAAAGAIALICALTEDKLFRPFIGQGECSIPVLMVRSSDEARLLAASLAVLDLTTKEPETEPEPEPELEPE
jgi:hypothetical protein